jgi:hypothetical protein
VGITIIDIVIYAAVILAFVFISVFIVSGLTQGWKRAFPSAFIGLGSWIYVVILFLLIALIIGILRDCIFR